MYVNVTKKKYKNITYCTVRVIETYYQNGKKINKVVKKIGNTTEEKEVEKLRRIAWQYILDTQKDIRISLSEIKKIKIRSPIGMMKMIEMIFSNLGIRKSLEKIFNNNYEYFLDEITYRFYSITSERMLFLTTKKPKDRYYRVLDNIFLRKRELEDLFYSALVRKGRIKQHEVKIDSTSTYFEGNGISLAMYGYSRDHRSDKKQIIILLVLIDNYPLFSYIFEGNKKDVAAFLEIVKDLKTRIKCKRFIIICDRGFFDIKYLEKLEESGLFYIMAVPRRKGDWATYHNKETNEFFIDKRRAILYENTELRNELLKILKETVNKIEEDLKVLTSSEIRRKHKYALKFIDLKRMRLKNKIIEKEKNVLGRWMVVTNLMDKSREEIVNEYKSLQEIERYFRVLKNELNIRPIGHSKDERCIAHIYICVLALLIKHILEEDLGKDKVEEIKQILSYEIVTKNGSLIWEENL